MSVINSELVKANARRVDNIKAKLTLSSHPLSRGDAFFLLSQLANPTSGYCSVPEPLKKLIRGEGLAIAVELLDAQVIPWWAWLRRRLKASLRKRIIARVRIECEGGTFKHLTTGIATCPVNS